MKTLPTLLIAALLLTTVTTHADNLPGGSWTRYVTQGLTQNDVWSLIGTNNNSVIAWGEDLNTSAVAAANDYTNTQTHWCDTGSAYRTYYGIADDCSGVGSELEYFDINNQGETEVSINPTGHPIPSAWHFIVQDDVDVFSETTFLLSAYEPYLFRISSYEPTTGLVTNMSIFADGFNFTGLSRFGDIETESIASQAFCTNGVCANSTNATTDVDWIVNSITANISDINASQNAAELWNDTNEISNAVTWLADSVTNNITYLNSSTVDRNDWTTHDDYPTGCSGSTYIKAIGDTLTCSTPTDTNTDTWNEIIPTSTAKTTTKAYNSVDGYTCSAGSYCIYNYDFGHLESFHADCTISSYSVAGRLSVGYNVAGADNQNSNNSITGNGLYTFDSSPKEKTNPGDIIAMFAEKISGTFTHQCMITMYFTSN